MEKLEALAEDVALDKTTVEVETKDIKAETVKVDALSETTEDKTTATAVIGIVQSVRIIISHSELNATAVEKPVALVEDAVLDKTTAEVETKDTRVETVKVDASRETTEVKTTATAEIGIVQNVEIIISHSGLNVIRVDFQKVVGMTVVAVMTDTEAMTVVEEMTVVEKRKFTPITIGIALNVTIPISHSDRNVIAVKHLAPVVVAAVVAVANVETIVDDHLNVMAEDHLDVMMGEDLHNGMTVLEPLDAMTVGDHHNEMMVRDLLDTKVDDRLVEMDETEEVTEVAIKAVAHTIKAERLNASQENLETLENHRAMDQGMLITAHQSHSSTQTEMIERG